MNKKLFIYLFAALFVAMSFSSCHSVEVGADEEAALVMQPWFFGHGGVDETPVSTGLTWCAATTYGEIFKIVPLKYKEHFCLNSLWIYNFIMSKIFNILRFVFLAVIFVGQIVLGADFKVISANYDLSNNAIVIGARETTLTTFGLFWN